MTWDIVVSALVDGMTCKDKALRMIIADGWETAAAGARVLIGVALLQDPRNSTHQRENLMSPVSILGLMAI